MKLWYLSKLLKGIKLSSSTKMFTEDQHAVKVLTQKGICGTVLTVQYLLSGEHKNYDHVLTSNSTILSTFQVNNLHVTMHNMLSGGNQTDGNTLETFLTPYQYSTLPLTH